jgi:peroxiredoxin
MMADLDIGMRAPDFTLASTTGDNITLSEVLKEKNAVLAFYVLAFTSV